MHLFLSPHYDDAVYSCGGTIHQLCQQGQPVTVITLMGGNPPAPLPTSPLIQALHARWAVGENPVDARRAEDNEAVALLGAGVKHHHIPDGIYRTDEQGAPLYPTEAHLWHTVHAQDPALKRMSGLRLHPEATHIYVPLGVGGHVDHLIVRDLGLGMMTFSTAMQILGTQHDRVLHMPQILFYAEYPYIEDAAALSVALAALSADYHLLPAPMLLQPADIHAKIQAVAAYRSQVSTFWRDTAELAERVQAALTLPDCPAPAEMFYSLQRS